jgi:hypothetical protein
MIGHMQVELEALYKLAQELIVGDPVNIDYSFDLEINGQDVNVVQILRGCSTYLLTSESDEKGLNLVLRSTEIPDLLITLPSPICYSLGNALEIGDFC